MLEWLELHRLPCLVRGLWGVECPTCGMQTALLLLLRGNIADSFKTYPPLIPLLGFVMLAVISITGVKKIKLDVLKISGFICLIIILISYLLKLSL